MKGNEDDLRGLGSFRLVTSAATKRCPEAGLTGLGYGGLIEKRFRRRYSGLTVG